MYTVRVRKFDNLLCVVCTKLASIIEALKRSVSNDILVVIVIYMLMIGSEALYPILHVSNERLRFVLCDAKSDDVW